MSINKVMILNPFILLPDEKIRFETPTFRTSFNLEKQPISARLIKAIGKLYLTNKRIVVITTEGDYKSLNVLIPQIKTYKFQSDGFLKSLIIGANKFELLFVTGDDIDIGLERLTHYSLIVQFNDGGIYEFAKQLEDIHTAFVNDQLVDEQLPAYTE